MIWLSVCAGGNKNGTDLSGIRTPIDLPLVPVIIVVVSLTARSAAVVLLVRDATADLLYVYFENR